LKTWSQAFVELFVRDTRSGAMRLLDRVRYYPHNSVVVVLSGEYFSGSNPAASGLFPLAENLYADDGYNAYFFDEDDVSVLANGPVYDLVVHQLRDYGIRQVSIVGHSHGGGSTYNLLEHVQADAAGLVTVPYSAYVDAIINDYEFGTDYGRDPERRRSSLSLFHSNFWQWYYWPLGPDVGVIHGDYVPGADEDRSVDSFWGDPDTHETIDSNQHVHDAIREHIRNRVTR
jgi:hypothetical protein